MIPTAGDHKTFQHDNEKTVAARREFLKLLIEAEGRGAGRNPFAVLRDEIWPKWHEIKYGIGSGGSSCRARRLNGPAFGRSYVEFFRDDEASIELIRGWAMDF